MDKVFVIYLDGKMYKSRGRKCAYLEEKYVKQVVSADTKEVARDMAHNNGKYFYELTNEEEQVYIDEAKKRFEIREFVERR